MEKFRLSAELILGNVEGAPRKITFQNATKADFVSMLIFSYKSKKPESGFIYAGLFKQDLNTGFVDEIDYPGYCRVKIPRNKEGFQVFKTLKGDYIIANASSIIFPVCRNGSIITHIGLFNHTGKLFTLGELKHPMMYFRESPFIAERDLIVRA